MNHDDCYPDPDLSAIGLDGTRQNDDGATMKNRTKQRTSKPGMKQRVPFFDLEYSMSWGYAHDPYASYCSSADDPWNCAIAYQALKDKMDDAMQYRCIPKCDLCKRIGETTDYIRGFKQVNGKRIAAEPNYPVPMCVEQYPNGNNILPAFPWNYWNETDIENETTYYLSVRFRWY